jgi:hypothetical protein
MHAPNALNVVMPGFKPGIHVLRLDKAWMAGTSPAMTNSQKDVTEARC